MFDLSQAFKSLQFKGEEMISKFSVAEFLETRHYFATEKELSYLFNRFDRDEDGLICYSEFVKELTSRIQERV